MTTIKAIVRNGRLEVEEPLDLPDGTVLQIPLPNGEAVEGDGPMTPEEIEQALAALKQIIPYDRTPDEEARLEADRLARKGWEKAHFFERGDKLRGMWE